MTVGDETHQHSNITAAVRFHPRKKPCIVGLSEQKSIYLIMLFHRLIRRKYRLPNHNRNSEEREMRR